MTKPSGIPTTITDWGDPKRKIKSNLYGIITYKRWCTIEAKRINETGGTPCGVRTNTHGEVAVAPDTFRHGL